MNNRLEKLRSRFKEKGIDGIFITQRENRRYLSGFDGSSGYLVISKQKAVLATDFRYTEQAVAEAPDFEILRIANNISDWFPGLIDDMEIKKAGFEARDVSYEFHRQLTEALKKKRVKAEMVPVDGLVEHVRAVKEPGEIELIRRACMITSAAYESVANRIRPGMTEA